VVGQVLFGRLLTVLRRLAEEHYSFLRFGTTDEHGRPTCRPPQHGSGRADP
jgi:hypothetical protein